MRMLLEDEQEEEKKPPGLQLHALHCLRTSWTLRGMTPPRLPKPCRPHLPQKTHLPQRQHLPQRPHLPRLRPRPRLRPPPLWSRATRRSTPRRPQRRRAQTAQSLGTRAAARRRHRRQQLMDWTQSVPRQGPRARGPQPRCVPPSSSSSPLRSSRPSRERPRQSRTPLRTCWQQGTAHRGPVVRSCRCRGRAQRMGRTQTRYCPSQRARPRDHAPPRPHRRGRHRPPTQRVR